MTDTAAIPVPSFLERPMTLTPRVLLSAGAALVGVGLIIGFKMAGGMPDTLGPDPTKGPVHPAHYVDQPCAGCREAELRRVREAGGEAPGPTAAPYQPDEATGGVPGM
jgi:hypothetical protein